MLKEDKGAIGVRRIGGAEEAAIFASSAGPFSALKCLLNILETW